MNALYTSLFALNLQIVGLVIVPVLLVLACRNIWHAVPRWISALILLSAVLAVATRLSMLLLTPYYARIWGAQMLAEYYAKLSFWLSFAGWVGTLSFVSAFFGLSLRVKDMAEEAEAATR